MKGFTLLELLVSVTIFAGIIILSMAVFARTISSSARANNTRQKTEAARSISDQISGDFRYVSTTKDITVGFGCPAPATNEKWFGYCYGSFSTGLVSSDGLFMLLKYPGQDADTYTARTYYFDGVNNIFMGEAGVGHECKLSLSNCQPTASTSTAGLLSSSYWIDHPAGTQIFSGQGQTTTGSGFLNLVLTIKPNNTLAHCSGAGSVDIGTCYSLNSTLVPGGLN